MLLWSITPQTNRVVTLNIWSKFCQVLFQFLSAVVFKLTGQSCKVFMLSQLHQQNFSYQCFQSCQNSTLLCFKSETVVDQVNHSFVFTKPWPICGGPCWIDYQHNVVIFNYLRLLQPAVWVRLQPGWPIEPFIFQQLWQSDPSCCNVSWIHRALHVSTRLQ